MKMSETKLEQKKEDIVATGKCVMCGRPGEVKVYETKEILCKSCYNVNSSIRHKK